MSISWPSAAEARRPGQGISIPGSLRGHSPADVQALVTSLQALSSRMQGLVEARAQPQAESPGAGTAEGFQGLALRVQAVFQGLSRDTSAGRGRGPAPAAERDHARMEQRIEQTLDKATEGQTELSKTARTFYRLLGAYRGVSEAMVAYAGTAGGIDWDRWREARF